MKVRSNANMPYPAPGSEWKADPMGGACARAGHGSRKKTVNSRFGTKVLGGGLEVHRAERLQRLVPAEGDALARRSIRDVTLPVSAEPWTPAKVAMSTGADASRAVIFLPLAQGLGHPSPWVLAWGMPDQPLDGLRCLGFFAGIRSTIESAEPLSRLVLGKELTGSHPPKRWLQAQPPPLCRSRGPRSPRP